VSDYSKLSLLCVPKSAPETYHSDTLQLHCIAMWKFVLYFAFVGATSTALSSETGGSFTKAYGTPDVTVAPYPTAASISVDYDGSDTTRTSAIPTTVKKKYSNIDNTTAETELAPGASTNVVKVSIFTTSLFGSVLTVTSSSTAALITVPSTTLVTSVLTTTVSGRTSEVTKTAVQVPSTIDNSGSSTSTREPSEQSTEVAIVISIITTISGTPTVVISTVTASLGHSTRPSETSESSPDSSTVSSTTSTFLSASPALTATGSSTSAVTTLSTRNSTPSTTTTSSLPTPSPLSNTSFMSGPSLSSTSSILAGSSQTTPVVITIAGDAETEVLTVSGSNTAKLREPNTVLTPGTLSPTDHLPPKMTSLLTATSSSSATAATTPFSGFDVPTVKFSLDGIDYTAPVANDAPLELILSDGTLALVEFGWITINSQRAKIPQDPGSGVSSSVGGWTVSFSLRQLAGGHAPGDVAAWFTSVVSKFAGVAGQAFAGMQKIGTSLFGDAIYAAAESAGAVADAEVFEMTDASGFANSNGALSAIDDAFEDFEQASSTIDSMVRDGSLQSSFDNLGNMVNNMRPSDIRLSRNLLRNLRQIFQQINQSSDQAFKKKMRNLIRGRYDKWIGIGVGSSTGFNILAGSLLALHRFNNTNPKSADEGEPKGRPPLINTTVNMTDNPLRKWFIQTDMQIPVFHSFIKMLDGGEGYRIADEIGVHKSGPGYFSSMRSHTATLVSQLPLVAYVYLHPNAEEELANQKARIASGFPLFGGKVPRRQLKHKTPQGGSTTPRGEFTTQGTHRSDESLIDEHDALNHLKILSWQKGKPEQDQIFRYDDSSGRGTTVFIIDTGFDVAANMVSTDSILHLYRCLLMLTVASQDEYGVRGKSPDEFMFVVPNKLTLPDVDPSQWLPENMMDYYSPYNRVPGHGTKVAGLAVGKYFGVARNADVFLIKVANGWIKDTEGQMVLTMGEHHPDAWRAAFGKVEKVVEDRGLQGKAVVNLSFCK